MINLSGVEFGYKKHNKLFDKLNLTLSRRHIYGLLGKNGAGKSSLLRLIAGLIFPLAGECKVLGYSASVRSPFALADLYFLSEDIYLPKMTAIAYVKLYSSFYPKFNHNLLEKGIELFQLPTDQLLTELSYGQRKKFLLAFAVATSCKIHLYDEPTNGLDIPSKSVFRQFIAEAMQDDQLYIISTHQVHDVEKLIDAIILIDEGDIVVNEGMDKIAQILQVSSQKEQPKMNECIYYEKAIGGYNVLTVNKNGDESQIDLELLFNAVLSNKAAIKQLLLGE